MQPTRTAFVGLIVLITLLFIGGGLTLFSFMDNMQQQQADLALSMAAMNKNRVRMELFWKSKQAASRAAAEDVEAP